MTELPRSLLSEDHARAPLVGRVLDQKRPRTVAVRDRRMIDLSPLTPTMSDLPDFTDPAAGVSAFDSPALDLDESALLAPPDLQAIKAAGVSFVDSRLERAGGNPRKAMLVDRLRSGTPAISGLSPPSQVVTYREASS